MREFKTQKEHNYFRSAPNYNGVQKIDLEKGIIEGVAIVTMGEAKGHGVHLDQEFIEQVAEQGNEYGQGLKARFGHPNMCGTALGTFVGRFKNFSVDGSITRADLHLDETAKKSPNGNLYDYVLEMAEKNPDMFGTSIVFSDKGIYKKDSEGNHHTPTGYSAAGYPEYKKFNEEGEEIELSEETFIYLKQLHATDVVDEPAANESLFSSSISLESLAETVTNFLDANPKVWEIIDSKPELFSEFATRYQAYKERNEKNIFQKIAGALGFSQKDLENQGGQETNQPGNQFDIEKETTEGQKIIIKTNSETPEQGDQVVWIDEDETEQPAENGNYIATTGETYVIENGEIIEIIEPQEDEPEETGAELSALQEKIELKEREFEAMKLLLSHKEEEIKRLKSPAAEPTTGAPDGDTFNDQGDEKLQSWEIEANKIRAMKQKELQLNQ